jgi:hypothetical protein
MTILAGIILIHLMVIWTSGFRKTKKVPYMLSAFLSLCMVIFVMVMMGQMEVPEP